MIDSWNREFAEFGMPVFLNSIYAPLFLQGMPHSRSLRWLSSVCWSTNYVTHSSIFWPPKWPFIIGNTSNKNEQCFTLHDTAPSIGEGIPEHPSTSLIEEGHRVGGKRLPRMMVPGKRGQNRFCVNLKGGFVLSVELRSPDQSWDRMITNNLII